MAPGAWPSKFALPSMLFAAVMPATCVPCAASGMPMLTKSASWPGSPAGVRSTSSRNSTTNGMRSAIAVAGLSVPKWPTSNFSLYGRITASSVKSRFWFGVDPDVVAGRVVEDAEQVGGVAVAVDVAGRVAGRR